MGASQLMIYRDGAWVPWDGTMTVVSADPSQSKDDKQPPKQAKIASPRRKKATS